MDCRGCACRGCSQSDNCNMCDCDTCTDNYDLADYIADGIPLRGYREYCDDYEPGYEED